MGRHGETVPTIRCLVTATLSPPEFKTSEYLDALIATRDEDAACKVAFVDFIDSTYEYPGDLISWVNLGLRIAAEAHGREIWAIGCSNLVYIFFGTYEEVYRQINEDIPMAQIMEP